MALSGDEHAELNRLCEAEAERVARAKADADALAAAEADRTARAKSEADERACLEAEARAREAAAIADLHSQAVGLPNIWMLVPIILDLSTPNYSKWRHLFLLLVGKYALTDHVLSNEVFPMVPAWARMECTVLGWLQNTISAELSEIVTAPTARRVWLGIEEQFVGNRETRALFLDAELRNFFQGDLSMTDYLRKMKSMADALGDLGEPVHDRTLVLNVLRGLNEKYSHLASLIARQRPFPSFIDVRADLHLEEITQKAKLVPSPPSSLLPHRPRRAHAPPWWGGCSWQQWRTRWPSPVTLGKNNRKPRTEPK